MSENKKPVQTPKGTNNENNDLNKKPIEGEEVIEDIDEGSEEGKDGVIIDPTEEIDEHGNPKVTPPVKEPVVEKKPAPVVTVDYKEKFGNSTRRNQIVESQFRDLQKVLGDITKQEIPTDEEMKLTDSDWEFRSPFEKNLAIKTVVLERRQNHILKTIGNISNQSEYADKINTFVASKEQLKGKEDAFYEFATKDSNKGASLDVLLNAFLFEVKDEEEIHNPNPENKETPPSLERATPSGGIIPEKKDGKYTDEEIKVIRETDHRRYNDLVRRGLI